MSSGSFYSAILHSNPGINIFDSVLCVFKKTSCLPLEAGIGRVAAPCSFGVHPVHFCLICIRSTGVLWAVRICAEWKYNI